MMFPRVFSAAAVLPALSLFLTPCNAGAHVPSAPVPTSTFSTSFSDALASSKNLTSFSDLLHSQYPDLLSVINEFDHSTKPVTILAPSNHAFDQIPYTAYLQDWFAQNDTFQISALLAYHILDGTYTNSTLDGDFVFPRSYTSGTNFSRVTGGQRAGAVLQGGDPPEIVFTSGLSTRSVVTEADIPFKGGYIQMVDNFMIPPVPVIETADTYQLANEPSSLTSFIGAVYSTSSTPLSANNMSLPQYLNQTQDLTFFVPINYALEITSGALLAMDNASLLNILSYHVLAVPNGPLYSSDFTRNSTMSISTLQGTAIQMTFNSNAHFVNSARVLTTDILFYNGVMHVIDNVLDPSAANVQPNPTSATQAPVLPTTGIANFNASMAPFTTFNPDVVPSSTPTTSTSFAAGMYGSSTLGGVSSTPTTTNKKSAAVRLALGPGRSALAVVVGVWASTALWGALFVLV